MTGVRPAARRQPGSACPQCGSTETVGCGRLVNGEQRWTCGPCKRRRNQGYAARPTAASARRRGISQASEYGHPYLVSDECSCGDRHGDDPQCVRHEDVPLAG